MKTNLRNQSGKFWMGTAAMFAVLLVFATPRTASAQWTTDGNNIYYNGGNVGIGTTTPTSLQGGFTGLGGRLMQIQNTSGLSQLVISGSSTGAFVGFEVGTATAGKRLFQQFYDGASNLMKFRVLSESAGTVAQDNILVLQNTGNVGIGTASPVLKLDVAGSGRFTGSATSVLTGSIDPTASPTVTGGGTLFTTELVIGDRITVTGETRTVVAITSNTSLTVDKAFADNANDTSPDKLPAILVARDSANTPKLVMNDLGNISLGGYGSPSQVGTPLSVLTLAAAANNTDGQVLTFRQNDTSIADLQGYGRVSFYGDDASVSSSGERAYIYGVGETGTQGETGLAFGTATTATAVAERMRITNAGNVGIGIAAPAYKLDIQGGQLNASGGLCIAGDCKTLWSQVGGGVTSVFGRAGAVVGVAGDYTWAQIDKTTSSLGNLTTRSAGDLSSGTLPDARFPATLPAASGASLTALNASNLASGTLPDARFPATLPATSGLNLTALNASNLASGTLPDARFPTVLPAGSGANLTTLSATSLASGTVATARLGSGTANATTFLRGDNTWAVPSGGSQWSNGGSSTISYSSGNVGIGTTADPSEKLEVNGNLKLSGTGNITATGTIEGNIIRAKYQDLAEWVPSSQEVPSGTVVVLDSTKSNHVIPSTVGYDTRVAGVISAQPGITLGESGPGKVLVATTGRVLVQVDASKGPIHIGDLLVTSDVPGMAMKSVPVNLSGVQLHRPGTLIGKALEPLEKGSGKILVLLSLQ